MSTIICYDRLDIETITRLIYLYLNRNTDEDKAKIETQRLNLEKEKEQFEKEQEAFEKRQEAFEKRRRTLEEAQARLEAEKILVQKEHAEQVFIITGFYFILIIHLQFFYYVRQK